MVNIVFDLETTGIPIMRSYNEYYDYKDLEKYERSRICQIAYMCVDDDYNIISEKEFKIKGIDVGDSVKYHNLTNDILEKHGRCFKDVIKEIYEDFNNCKSLIAHNINFDLNVLSSELYRSGYLKFSSMIRKKNIRCSMLILKNRVCALNKYGKVKYPTLTELHQYAFGNDIEIKNAHNAYYDVLALVESLKELKRNHGICILNGFS